jgi:DNA-binding CsgD family transcriptional regulator
MAEWVLPWSAIHTYLVDVGKLSDPHWFCVRIVEKIRDLIPYDQARIFIINDNGNVVDAVVFGANKKWNRVYLDYYYEDGAAKYTFTGRESSDGLIGLHDWFADECDDFVANYIVPQGIRYSMGFGLVDDASRIKSVFSLDRVNLNQFTVCEQAIMEHLHPHLNNLHRMLLHTPPTEQRFHYASETDKRLTPREAEIADYLSRGITPTNISKQLCLSSQTVYRHIANIHKKLQVTNRQELIIKWIRIKGHDAES